MNIIKPCRLHRSAVRINTDVWLLASFAFGFIQTGIFRNHASSFVWNLSDLPRFDWSQSSGVLQSHVATQLNVGGYYWSLLFIVPPFLYLCHRITKITVACETFISRWVTWYSLHIRSFMHNENLAHFKPKSKYLDRQPVSEESIVSDNSSEGLLTEVFPLKTSALAWWPYLCKYLT